MRSTDVSDLDLVLAVQAGRTDVYGDLVGRYQGMVASVAWRYGVPRDEIDDAVADVFVKVYRNIDRYRPMHPFSTWLYRVAVNEILDRARRRKREGQRAEIPENLADRRPGASERVLTDERHALLQRAVADLDDRYREVIFLVHVEGLKVEEAAAMLGIPDGTVKTRLMRGRRALKEKLERAWPEHFGGLAR